MKNPNIGIGHRAVAEINRLFPKRKHALIAIGCGKNVMKDWNYGAPLTGADLLKLHELGADVLWILTGTREDK